MGDPVYEVIDRPDADRPSAALAGEIDAKAVIELRAHLMELASQGRGLELDLSQVTFIDSSGLGLIAELLRAVNGAPSGLRLTSPSPAAQRVIELGGLGDLV